MLSNLNLIDWSLVGFSALWIIGLGLILAALSYADYEAERKQRRRRAVLEQPGYQVSLNAGLALFCLGLLGIAGALWEQLIWTGLALWFAVQTWRLGRLSRAQRPPPQD